MRPFDALGRLLNGDPASARLLAPAARPSAAQFVLAAILGFLAALALALALAAGDLAAEWDADLADSATLQIVGDEPQMEAQARAALEVLRTTPGVLSVRMVEVDEQRALLEPWLGAGAALDGLPLPLLIAVEADYAVLDGPALSTRLAAEAPGAVFDDHAAWRAPLVASAERLAAFGWACAGLLGIALLAVATLAARAAVAASGRDIATLRLVGARDRFIGRAFTRRFAFSALVATALGTAAALGLVALLPPASEAGIFLGLGLAGWHWAVPLLVPVAAGVIAWAATARVARRALRRSG
jgi:cell division transport system permease protein